MTAITVLPLPDAVYLFSDGAAYSEDGTLQSIVGKTHILSSISTAVMFSGRSIIVPYLVHHLESDVGSFDELRDIVDEKLPSYEQILTDLFGEDHHSPAGGANGFRMFVAGWSDRERKLSAFSISNSTKSRVEMPYQVVDAGGGYQTPGISAQDWLDACGVLPNPSPETIENIALTSLEIQRRHKWEPHNDCRVGGHIEFVKVQRDNVQVRILKRWSEDSVGEKLQPAPIDWQDWRRRHPINDPMSGMSKLQREMYLKKQAKAKRRAA